MKLTTIDLSLGDEKDHPDWNEEDYFLVEKVVPVYEWRETDEYDEYEELIQEQVATGEYESSLHFGQFQKVWFGWHFDCGWGASGGFQYDKPGHNCSNWNRVWKLEGYNFDQGIDRLIAEVTS